MDDRMVTIDVEFIDSYMSQVKELRQRAEVAEAALAAALSENQHLRSTVAFFEGENGMLVSALSWIATDAADIGACVGRAKGALESVVIDRGG